MTLHELISKPEFWAALFGALAAFVLGALATWWASVSTKRTAGNLTLVLLSQMYGIMENVRHKLFVAEPLRYFKITGAVPYSFQLRALMGVPQEHIPRVPFDQLGFLADSDDPDVMSRLLTVERAFVQMLDMVHRHERLQAELMGKLSVLDPTGRSPISPDELIVKAGAKVLIEIDDAVEGLRKGLPETRDALLQIGRQLRQTLRRQFPTRRFVGFEPVPRSSRTVADPPDLLPPRRWRLIARSAADGLRRLGDPRAPPVASAPSPDPPGVPEIKRFPPRSYGDSE